MPLLIKGFHSKNLGMFLNIAKKKSPLRILRSDSSLIFPLHLQLASISTHPWVALVTSVAAKLTCLHTKQAGIVCG